MQGVGAKRSPTEKFDVSGIVNNYDVMLCSYEVLSRETAFARKPPERPRRSTQTHRYERPRSLLVEIDFLRVCMDEVQCVSLHLFPLPRDSPLTISTAEWLELLRVRSARQPRLSTASTLSLFPAHLFAAS